MLGGSPTRAWLRREKARTRTVLIDAEARLTARFEDELAVYGLGPDTAGTMFALAAVRARLEEFGHPRALPPSYGVGGTRWFL